MNVSHKIVAMLIAIMRIVLVIGIRITVILEIKKGHESRSNISSTNIDSYFTSDGSMKHINGSGGPFLGGTYVRAQIYWDLPICRISGKEGV